MTNKFLFSAMLSGAVAASLTFLFVTKSETEQIKIERDTVQTVTEKHAITKKTEHQEPQICFRVRPYGTTFWIVEYKSALLYKKLHVAFEIPGQCVLNPLLVESLDEGKDLALSINRSGVDEYEKEQKRIYAECQRNGPKEPANIYETTGQKAMETVEFCP